MTEGQVKLLQALICDDVRREFNGKEIIIGVYQDEIILEALPATIELSLWMRLKMPDDKDHPAEFRAVDPQGTEVVRTPPLPLHAQRPQDQLSVVLPPAPLLLKAPGRLSFQWRLVGGEWAEIVSIRVKKGEIALPPGLEIRSPSTAA